MSSGLHAQLEFLSKQADRLQAQCVDLAEAIADLLQPQKFGDWVLVDDGFPPLPIQEFTALKALQRFHGLEDGFPEVPEECVRVIAHSLPCEPEEVVNRARKAYVSGFLARIAISTCTSFERTAKFEDEDLIHWVILYRHTPAINRRVTSRKCLEVAISVEEDCVWEGFRSISELIVFCAGAGVFVQRLDKWTSPW